MSKLVTFHLKFYDEYDDVVEQDFEGYAVFSGNGFAISDVETGVPLIILPMDRVIYATSTQQDVYYPDELGGETVLQ